MKPAGIIGIILIIVGIIGFAYGGLGWTTEKKAAQLGPIEIKHHERHGIDFPPILSGLCVVGGFVLVVVGSRQTWRSLNRSIRDPPTKRRVYQYRYTMRSKERRWMKTMGLSV